MAKKKPVTKKPEEISFKCTCHEYDGVRLAIFFATADQLWSIVQVNRREEDNDKGYQRAVNSGRVKKIASFIDEGNIIPTSLLVSFENANVSGSKLVIPNEPNAGWVIDGQHRLAGGYLAESKIPFPVVAILGASIEDQINYFVTINKEQKGVSTSLYLDLLPNLPGERNDKRDAEERAVDLAKQLKMDEESPFFGRIVTMTTASKGRLSLTNFVRKVHPLLKRPAGRLESYNDEKRANIFNSYYRGLKHAFPEEYENDDSIFFKTLGFGALVAVLPYVLQTTMARSKSGRGFSTKDVSTTFSSIEDFDFSAWKGLSGSGVEKIATEQLRQALEDGNDTDNFDDIQF